MVESVAYVEIGDAEDPHVWSGTPFHILQALRQSGVRVELISPLRRTFKYRYALHKLFNRNFQIDREASALRSYRDQILAALNRVDVDLILSSSSVPVSLLNCNRPVVFWTDAVYDSMPAYYPGFDLATANARHAHEQERNSLRNATWAVYSSEWGAREARKYYPEFASKVRVIPYGANLDIDPPPINRPHPIPCNLLFFGVDWERKGGPIALETAKILNEMGIEAKLKIVGCEPPGELPPCAEVLGFISKREQAGRAAIRRLFEEASFLLLPTRAECSAIAFCESAAYSLPVISTDTGGVSTYVRNGVNGELLALDAPPQQYAEVIRKIISTGPDVYAQLCRGARQEYVERLNWKTGVSACLALG